VLANYAWKMLVFSDAAKRWRHIMWLDAGQELRAGIDGVRAALHSPGASSPAIHPQHTRVLTARQATSSRSRAAT
jgi:hypothetical protein